jgi:hypothetical protein
MKRGFFSLTLASMLLAASPALAQSGECMDRNLIVENLAKNLFTLQGRGLQVNGNVLELYTNPNGTFVMLALQANMPPKMPAIIACPVSSGEYWFAYKPHIDRPEKPSNDKKS